jgi:hypothetical protein
MMKLLLILRSKGTKQQQQQQQQQASPSHTSAYGSSNLEQRSFSLCVCSAAVTTKLFVEVLLRLNDGTFTESGFGGSCVFFLFLTSPPATFRFFS